MNKAFEKILERLEENCVSPTDYPGYMVDLEVACNIVQEVAEEWQKNMKLAYNKAIDDFTEGLTTYLGVENVTKYGNKDAGQQANSYSTIMKYEIADAIEDVAEQLKEQNK